MSDRESGCFNCGRAEAQVPLLAWRYQGHALSICPDCLPLLIHKREQLMTKWPPEGDRSGEDDGLHQTR